MGRKAKSDGGTATRGEPESHTWEVIRSLVTSEAEASKLLEMYYWTREPGIVELIRAYLNLPDRGQRHLSDFLLKNRPQLIASMIDQQGQLVLSAAEQSTHQRRSGS